MTEKNDRCWPGYEPVKGKKEHEQGSCRPAAESKLTSSEKEYRRKRKGQLDKWQSEHPGARKSAAQHLHAPDEKAQSKVSETPGKKSTKRKSTKRKSPAKKSR